MKIIFVSNYINHHQAPFCEALSVLSGGDFIFLQMQSMDEERIAMGWGGRKEYSYVRKYSEAPDQAAELIRECDVLLVGGDFVQDLLVERLKQGKPVVRISERIYREGQWKMISPRGLLHKYNEYIRYRKAPYYLLCAGAYVASDFHLIHAFPGKMYRWGYFPELSENTEKPANEVPVFVWAGRMIPLKHPEYAVRLAADLCRNGEKFRMEIAGGGELEEDMKKLAEASGAADRIRFHGAQPPERIRQIMAGGDIFLFTSNYLEGWGAVVNEAMGSGCAVAGSTHAGSCPFLIRHGENGLLFNGEDYEDLKRKAGELLSDPGMRKRLGEMGKKTIETQWNADCAAKRFYEFCMCITEGRNYNAPEDGPMSRAPLVSPFQKV